MALAVMMFASVVLAPLPRAIAQEEKAPAEKPEKKVDPNRLSYGDGTADGKRSIAGTGEMVAFTLPRENAKVAGIRSHGSRYGYPQPPKENVMIYFLNKDLSETVATKTVPYSRFKRGEPQWVDIRFPKPLEVPREFWVCVDFRAAQTKGVYVSTDSSSDGAHSRVGLPGGEASEAKIQGDWMIEVLLAK
jgi:RNA polymerase sigma-70 factor (ECF subfamily)